MVFKKCRENPDNIVFIDASKHFGKGTQNYIRQEDIDKIVSTYQNRLNAPKYSYVASIQDIIDNDYNLNIPRYVDTFEEEEQIDLELISKELTDIDKKIKDTESVISRFCAELNINTPF